MLLTQAEIQAIGDQLLLVQRATAEQISNAERELGLVIPSEMKALLTISNGVKLPHPMIEDPAEAAEQGWEILFGLERQIQETGHFRMHWLSESEPETPPYADQINQFLIVAEDGGGNYIAYSPVGSESGDWRLGLLGHETRDFEPWENCGLLDLLSDLYHLHH